MNESEFTEFETRAVPLMTREEWERYAPADKHIQEAETAIQVLFEAVAERPEPVRPEQTDSHRELILATYPEKERAVIQKMTKDELKTYADLDRQRGLARQLKAEILKELDQRLFAGN